MKNKIIIFLVSIFFFQSSLAENLNIKSTSISIDKINEIKDTDILLTTSGGEIFAVNMITYQVKSEDSPSEATIYSVLYGYSPTVWLCTSDGFYTMTKNSKWKKKAGLYTAYGLAENEGKYWAVGRDEQKKAVLMLYFSEKKNASKKFLSP